MRRLLRSLLRLARASRRWLTGLRRGQVLGAGTLDLPTTDDDDDDPCEFKIVVLQALFQTDLQRGIMAATEWLKPGSTQTVRCKGAALTLLGRNGGKSVTPVILGVARSEPDLKLRARAISALGATNDDSVVDSLRDFALNSQENDIVEASLYALSRHTGERAITVLSDIAHATARQSPQRKLAISSIATRPGEPAVDALFRIYDADQNRRNSQGCHLRLCESQERTRGHQTLRHRTHLRQYRTSQSCYRRHLATRRR